ncbi:MAG: DUF4215 domain-containing protein [Nanoarchaeota archaeon]|nr:DUF4215 domain-containing protein [Nanoarchaeota archaeon]
MKKRGLSSVVTVMLLIAISIAAVIILWFYFRTGLVDLSEQIKTECVTLHLEPALCILNTDESLSITLKRNLGSEEILFSKAKLLFTFTDGDSKIIEVDNLPQTLDTAINLLPISKAELNNKQVKGIRASAVIEYDDKVGVCELSSKEITCSRERVVDEGSPTLGGGSNPLCGNSITESSEQCDDGNGVDTDSCVNCMNAVCGDSFIHQGNEICDDGSSNGVPGKCNLQCNGMVPTAPDCSDGTWATLNTWYQDLFTGETVSEFWADKDPAWQTRWTVENNELKFNKDDELPIVDLSGDFSLEMGWHIYTESSFGFFVEYLGDDGKIYRIYYKWSGPTGGPHKLRAFRDMGSYDEDGVFKRENRDGYKETLGFEPITEIDVKLVREENLFTWYYKFPPSTTWIQYAQTTLNDAKPTVKFFFDEGSGQALRYVKFQSDTSGTFPCS